MVTLCLDLWRISEKSFNALHCDEAGVWVFLELTNEFANLCRKVARLFCIECSFSDDVASQLASNDFKIEQLSICTKALYIYVYYPQN